MITQASSVKSAHIFLADSFCGKLSSDYRWLHIVFLLAIDLFYEIVGTIAACVCAYIASIWTVPSVRVPHLNRFIYFVIPTGTNNGQKKKNNSVSKLNEKVMSENRTVQKATTMKREPVAHPVFTSNVYLYVISTGFIRGANIVMLPSWSVSFLYV